MSSIFDWLIVLHHCGELFVAVLVDSLHSRELLSIYLLSKKQQKKKHTHTHLAATHESKSVYHILSMHRSRAVKNGTQNSTMAIICFCGVAQQRTYICVCVQITEQNIVDMYIHLNNNSKIIYYRYHRYQSDVYFFFLLNFFVGFLEFFNSVNRKAYDKRRKEKVRT